MLFFQVCHFYVWRNHKWNNKHLDWTQCYSTIAATCWNIITSRKWLSRLYIQQQCHLAVSQEIIFNCTSHIQKSCGVIQLSLPSLLGMPFRISRQRKTWDCLSESGAEKVQLSHHVLVNPVMCTDALWLHIPLEWSNCGLAINPFRVIQLFFSVCIGLCGKFPHTQSLISSYIGNNYVSAWQITFCYWCVSLSFEKYIYK